MTSWRSLVRRILARLGLCKEQSSQRPPARAESGDVPSATTVKPRELVSHQAGGAIETEGELLEDPPKVGDEGLGVSEALTLPAGDGAEDREQAAKTQFPGHGTEPTDLVVGMDFGTLSTRVVVRSPFIGDGRAVPVRWRAGDEWAHFLPTALDENPNAEFDLTSDWEEFDHGNLKTELMDHPKDLATRARAAAFLGLALRQARAFVLDTQADAYSPYLLRWTVHVGIPSAGYDDAKVKASFLGVARAAWLLSIHTERPTMETARAALERAEGREAIQADPDLSYVEVFPEIAALVVGYSRSRRRREGLHVMVDVGASTIDVCGFGLRDDDGDDQYLLFTALVERIGIRELHQQRMNAIRDAGAEFQVRALLNPFSEVPSAGRLYVQSPTQALVEELNRLDELYMQDCARAILKVIVDLKRWRDPNSPAWATGLPVFKAGGGARHILISHALREANYRLTLLSTAKGIDENPLPRLARLVDEDWSSKDGSQAEGGKPKDGGVDGSGEMAGRLGVAYGLSFDRFEIGEIVPPHEIADVPPKALAKPAEYISKDHV